MSRKQQKRLAQRFVDAVNARKFDELQGIFAHDVVWHIGTRGEMKGLDTFMRMNTTEGGGKIFPDSRTEILDIMSEEDKVAVRYSVTATHRGEFMGVAASGKKVTWSGIAIYRIEFDRIAEVWTAEDLFGLAVDLGAVKTQPSHPGNMKK